MENETKLQIRIWPDRILRRRCRKVTKVDDRIRGLLSVMQELMKTSDGVGLAANQAGLDEALVIIEAQDRLFKLVNPKIVKRSGQIEFEEGCLSFPGLALKINRSEKIWVTAQDENGDPLNLEVEGVLAVVFQHELDHINGRVFIDRISLWQRWKIRPVLNQIAKNEL
jgi:peptide deformylase